MTWGKLQNIMLTTRIGRSLADALFRSRARRRLVQLDQDRTQRGQYRALTSLVHRARQTHFGRDHDFQRIRNALDFRRLVPLRSPSEIWQQYGRPYLPDLKDCVWPGVISFLATCESADESLRAPLTVTSQLGETHRDALLTALAFVQSARPHARLLSGSLLLLGGGVALTPVRDRAARYTLENLVLREMPGVLRPFTIASPQSGIASLQSLTQRARTTSITTIVTSASRLIRLWSLLQKQAKAQSLLDLWPQLTAIIFARSSGENERERIQKMLGHHPQASSVLLLESVIHPQGVIAIEDPRYGQLRLLGQHGIYFELVEREPRGERARRLELFEAEPGVPYSLVMTSPAGIWAMLIGMTVVFDSVEPPLIREIRWEQSTRSTLSSSLFHSHSASTLNRPVGHRSPEDTPARHPEKLSRSLWSRREDQR